MRQNLLGRLKKGKVILLFFVVVFLLWWFSLPKTIFSDPYSTVVLSRKGQLLGARIADDGQWRFPKSDSVPDKFAQCILHFEDEYFYQHQGFNPISMTKALWGNLTTSKRRGGSTLTQQVIRLSRKNKKRTYLEKLVELCLATRLEVRFSKKEILNFYASHAPFGGNVVGLEASSWRYFGLPPSQLSWGQAASLAVLPNAPSLVFPGTNDTILRVKRNRLLKKLLDRNIIDETDYELSREEPLPNKPRPLPDNAPHLVELLRRQGNTTVWRSSIDVQLQLECNRLAQKHYNHLKGNQINNLAILVLDVEENVVLAYVGNSPTTYENGSFVDIIQRNRSTGSILKPFLFAAAMDEGQVLPRTMLRDVPTIINGYAPKNFDGSFQGVVAADRALSRSLNIPAVNLLRSFGLQKFHSLLPKMGIRSINNSAEYYGLSLILGGAESSLWELTNAYSGMVKSLNFFNKSSSEYYSEAFDEASLVLSNKKKPQTKKATTQAFGAGAIFKVLEALKEVNRPSGLENWNFFNDSQPMAWKTGTSFGYKDAWAIGVTPKFAIGIWAGNADGEGRPGLTGVQAAAPILFDVLEKLPKSGWFSVPFDDLIQVKTCGQSGHLAGPHCPEPTEEWVVQKGERTMSCQYHQMVQLDVSEGYRVNSECYPLDKMIHKSWFVLPPLLSYYYEKKHPQFRNVPPPMPGCLASGERLLEFIFPKTNETVLIPKDFEGVGEVVFALAHQKTGIEVFWYLDGEFIGQTQQFHEMALSPKQGKHELTVMDEEGNQITQQIEVRYTSE